jgi:hypothetical protein
VRSKRDFIAHKSRDGAEISIALGMTAWPANRACNDYVVAPSIRGWLIRFRDDRMQTYFVTEN